MTTKKSLSATQKALSALSASSAACSFCAKRHECRKACGVMFGGCSADYVLDLDRLSAAIALPDEFIEIAASRLKGEAYRAANEDVLAAKWLADYNQRLEAFQNWCDRRRTGGGAV